MPIEGIIRFLENIEEKIIVYLCERYHIKFTKNPVFTYEDLIEKDIGHILMTSESCTGRLLIISPKYGDARYKCDITADVKLLKPWAVNHAKNVWGGDNAARQALPFWLANADINSDITSDIPNRFLSILGPYSLDLLQKNMAELRCQDCNQVYKGSDIHTDTQNNGHDGAKSFYTTRWKCPQNHELYVDKGWVIV